MNDEEMQRYIWQIILSKPPICMSWGIDLDNTKNIGQGIEFHVQGYLHTGKVRVSYDEGSDTFTVCLISDSGENVKTIEDVFCDNLVSVIDENVEKTQDYEKRIAGDYVILL